MFIESDNCGLSFVLLAKSTFVIYRTKRISHKFLVKSLKRSYFKPTVPYGAYCNTQAQIYLELIRQVEDSDAGLTTMCFINTCQC